VRILHVIQEIAVGGAERVVLSLCDGAVAAGHEVAVAAAAGSLSHEFEGTTYELPLVERRLSRIPFAAWALRRALHEFRPGIVHLHNPGMAAVAAVATRRGRSVPGLVSVHGMPEEDYRSAARVLRLAGFPVVACGPGVASALENERAQVTATIVNGVGPAPTAADRAAVCKEWGLPADRPLILCLGRLTPQKNHTLAISALAQLPNVSLVVVGEGPLAGELQRQASELGVANRFVLAGVRTDARALIGACDAVCLPSVWEGLPLVALEALAAGKPLVATVGEWGIAELLSDGEDALLVPANDPTALASALERVLSDANLASRLAEGARRTAVLYSEEAMVTAYLDLYERLARRR
jgi:glycosyltransferase involved in cell wall biosynthesis